MRKCFICSGKAQLGSRNIYDAEVMMMMYDYFWPLLRILFLSSLSRQLADAQNRRKYKYYLNWPLRELSTFSWIKMRRYWWSYQSKCALCRHHAWSVCCFAMMFSNEIYCFVDYRRHFGRQGATKESVIESILKISLIGINILCE